MTSRKRPARPGNQKSKMGGGKNQKWLHEHSAGFILFRNSPAGPLYLLLDYGKHWDYPKGHLEKGESAWQAAVRELKEETGIRQVDRVGRFQQNMHYFFISKKKGPIAKTVTYFLGKTKKPTVTLSEEHHAHAWLPYEKALTRLTYQTAKDLLTAAHESLQNR
jgi:bis(5'-nucleosidyl)-tetraphosphatase